MNSEILKLLSANARYTYSQLAKMTGLTEEEVKKEIKELEKSGFAYAALIVVGYLLLGSKIGLTAYLAAFAALTLLLAALLLRWLHKTGCRIFANL